MYSEEMKLANFRLPVALLGALPEAQHALGKPSVAELVREALRDYLEQHDGAIKAYRQVRKRHS